MKPALVIWLTGLSGSGKSTIADEFSRQLKQSGKSVRIIDGDDIREKKHVHLDFSPECIKENNRLITQLCLDEMNNYDCLIVSVITPYEESRKRSRKVIGEPYKEVYVKATIDAVIARDVKGLYKRALNGEIKNFIGIDSNTPFETPQNPDLTIDTEKLKVDEAVSQLCDFVDKHALIT